MNRARPGSNIHVPIYIASSDSEDEVSTVTFQTPASAVHGIVNQEPPEHVEGVVNSFSNATLALQHADGGGDYRATVPINTTQVSFARELTRVGGLPPLPFPRPPSVIRGCTKRNALRGSQVQGGDVHLPEQASTRGLRRSPRQRNQVCYYEGSSRSALKQPRNVTEKPPKKGYGTARMNAYVKPPKGMFKCARMNASNCPIM